MSKKSEQIKHQEENLEHLESALTKSEAFIEKYQNHILIVLGAVLLVVLGTMGYSKYIVEPKEEAAQTEMYPSELHFEADSFQLALNGDGSSLGFLTIAQDYSSTPSGNLAKYYAGICYLHLGEYEEALNYLKKFSLKGEQLAPVALGAMGDCYLELDQTAKAISAYKEAAAYKNDLTTPIHLQKLGVAYEISGETDKAIEVYNQIKLAYPESTEAREIDKYIQRAKAVQG